MDLWKLHNLPSICAAIPVPSCVPKTTFRNTVAGVGTPLGHLQHRDGLALPVPSILISTFLCSKFAPQRIQTNPNTFAVRHHVRHPTPWKRNYDARVAGMATSYRSAVPFAVAADAAERGATWPTETQCKF